MYCPYTNEEKSPSEGNFDHIIPLSLGGNNNFVIFCDITKNSWMGSKVDGAIVNDPLVSLAIHRNRFKGHSNKVIAPRWRHVTLEDEPVQITLDTDKEKIWNLKQKRYMEQPEYIGKQFNAKLRIDRKNGIRYLAKIALGTGYYLYRERFLQSVDCNALRDIIFTVDYAKLKGTAMEASTIRVCDRFHPDSSGTGPAAIFRSYCEMTGRTMVIVDLTSQHFINFHTGVGGMYIGSIAVPMSIDLLEADLEEQRGCVILLSPGKMECTGYMDFARMFAREKLKMTGKEFD
jgi:hypothetical protein